MADATLDEKSMQIWKALVDTLKAEATSGGRLAGVQHVGNSIHLWTGKSPAIGVQLLRQPEEDAGDGGGGMGEHMIELKFQIVAGASSVDGATKANLDDANTALQTVVADGSGNGLSPVLRGLLRGGFAGAWRTKVRDVQWVWKIEDGEGVPVWAYAVVDFSVWIKVRI